MYDKNLADEMPDKAEYEKAMNGTMSDLYFGTYKGHDIQLIGEYFDLQFFTVACSEAWVIIAKHTKVIADFQTGFSFEGMKVKIREQN